MNAYVLNWSVVGLINVQEILPVEPYTEGGNRP